MSGHSKWHNIQAKKGKTDAARGKIFTKLGREIAMAVHDGGPNPEVNGKLQCCILWLEIKKTAGETNHITIRLTAEAVKAFINLHTWILVIMKRTFAHAPMSHLQTVTFCGLKRSHIGFYCWLSPEF